MISLSTCIAGIKHQHKNMHEDLKEKLVRFVMYKDNQINLEIKLVK
jgi:hypothetical protein